MVDMEATAPCLQLRQVPQLSVSRRVKPSSSYPGIQPASSKMTIVFFSFAESSVRLSKATKASISSSLSACLTLLANNLCDDPIVDICKTCHSRKFVCQPLLRTAKRLFDLANLGLHFSCVILTEGWRR